MHAAGPDPWPGGCECGGSDTMNALAANDIEAADPLALVSARLDPLADRHPPNLASSVQETGRRSGADGSIVTGTPARLTPLGHPTINLDGRYRTTSRPPTTGLRPLRTDLLRILYRSSSQARWRTPPQQLPGTAQRYTPAERARYPQADQAAE